MKGGPTFGGAVAVLLAAGALLIAGCGDSVDPADFAGTWDIVGTLVTTSSEVPGTPQPGFQTTDVWQIEADASGAVLTTPKGQLPGSLNGGGAHFYATGPLGYGVYIAVTIDCFLRGGGGMYGTEEIVYTGTNAVTGQPIPLGREAWTFDASRR